MQTGNINYIYKNDLDKACFQHDMAYGKYKDLNKRTKSDKVLRDEAFKLQVIQNMKEIKEDWLQWHASLLIKSQKAVFLNLCQINNLQMSLISQL